MLLLVCQRYLILIECVVLEMLFNTQIVFKVLPIQEHVFN